MRTAVRPARLADFHGQDHIKEVLETVINAAKKTHSAVPHLLFTGPAGCGKTTLSQVIATERGVSCHSLHAASLKTPEDLKRFLETKLNDEGYVRNRKDPIMRERIKPTVVFIDEIHRLKKTVAEVLYTIMEDRTYEIVEPLPGGQGNRVRTAWVPEFTLIGATTHEGKLEKPFVDRFKYKLKLRKYSDTECLRFVLPTLVGNNVKLGDLDAAKAIANRARGTARTAIRLAEMVVDYVVANDIPSLKAEHVTKVFALHNVDNIGLEENDIRYMQYLARQTKALGVKAIALYLEEAVETVETQIEPYLLQRGFIIRTQSGRVLSSEGIRYLAEQGLSDELDSRRLLD